MRGSREQSAASGATKEGTEPTSRRLVNLCTARHGAAHQADGTQEHGGVGPSAAARGRGRGIARRGIARRWFWRPEAVARAAAEYERVSDELLALLTSR